MFNRVHKGELCLLNKQVVRKNFVNFEEWIGVSVVCAVGHYSNGFFLYFKYFLTIFLCSAAHYRCTVCEMRVDERKVESFEAFRWYYVFSLLNAV